MGRVFSHIRERVAAEEQSLFICVLDEVRLWMWGLMSWSTTNQPPNQPTKYPSTPLQVETVCSSREAALARGSNEPGDAVRVVNAFLTEIDRLKAYPNILLIATSNITSALDAAFQDRCDLRIHVGLPSAEGRFHILCSALAELMRAGVVGPPVHLPPRLELLQHSPQQAAQALLRLVELSGLGAGGGLSGRALRKLPLQAHALMGGARPPPVPLGEFLRAMAGVLEAQAEEDATGAGQMQGKGGQQPQQPRRDYHQ